VKSEITTLNCRPTSLIGPQIQRTTSNNLWGGTPSLTRAEGGGGTRPYSYSMQLAFSFTMPLMSMRSGAWTTGTFVIAPARLTDGLTYDASVETLCPAHSRVMKLSHVANTRPDRSTTHVPRTFLPVFLSDALTVIRPLHKKRQSNVVFCSPCYPIPSYRILVYSFLQCFDTVGMVIWPVKIFPDMTYSVFWWDVKPCLINQSWSTPNHPARQAVPRQNHITG